MKFLRFKEIKDKRVREAGMVSKSMSNIQSILVKIIKGSSIAKAARTDIKTKVVRR